MSLLEFDRAAIPLAVFGMAVVVFVLPIWRVYRRSGVFPVVVFRSRNWRDRLIGAAALMLLPSLGAWAIAYAWLGPEGLGVWRVSNWVGVVAWCAVVSGIVLIMVAQAQMGVSLRMGIDDRPTDLVTHGIFRIVRNPIYTGLATALAGLATAAPSTLSVGTVAALIAGFVFQARLEEEHLTNVHGRRYRDYAASVGRFLPGIGKLVATE